MEPADEKQPMTVKEAGRRGGAIVSAKYGREFYCKIGEKGGGTTAKRYGNEFYSGIGALGGKATAEKHGQEFFKKIGGKGGSRVAELIRRAKEMEAKEAAEAGGE